jgi:hypothetical protein
MVILSFCVIKQHYLGNYCRMAVNYCGICVTNVKSIILSKMADIFNPKKK